MRKLISILAWFFVVITSICLVFTMLTTCKYISLPCFNNYYLLESSVVITMLLWSIKQIQSKSREWLNSILCMIMGFGTMIFMVMKVY